MSKRFISGPLHWYESPEEQGWLIVLGRLGGGFTEVCSFETGRRWTVEDKYIVRGFG